MEPNKKFYWKLGAVIFGSLAAAISFFFLIFGYREIKDFLSLIMSGLRPVLAGVVLAYVLCPIAKFLEQQFDKTTKLVRFSRAFSVLFTMLFAFALLGLFCFFINGYLLFYYFCILKINFHYFLTVKFCFIFPITLN